MTSKTKKHMDDLQEVDTLDEFAELKTEITAMIKDAALDADHRLEITGDHTYVLEPDGTLWLIHAGQRRATNTWRRQEWAIFREDVAHNRLRDRIAALKS